MSHEPHDARARDERRAKVLADELVAIDSALWELEQQRDELRGELSEIQHRTARRRGVHFSEAFRPLEHEAEP